MTTNNWFTTRCFAHVMVAFGLTVAISIAFCSSTLFACTTPVYQYAMYTWEPAPYYVFYFHKGDVSNEHDKQLEQYVKQLSTEGPEFANLIWYPVDVANKAEFEQLPQVVRDSWQRLEKASTDNPPESGFAVFTSWGAELYAGQLTKDLIDQMVDSPVRRSLGRSFVEGNGLVVLFLPGKNAEENRKAEKLLNKLISEVAKGTILGVPIYDPNMPYDMMGPESPQESDQADATDAGEPSGNRGVKVALIKLNPNDPKEKWLLAALFKIDPDLEKEKDKPMVFFCYGRGRVMPPFVGDGITEENLATELQFLTGACSCVIKDANPGVDLLMKWDWTATADALARAYSPEYGDPYGFGYQEVEAQPAPQEGNAEAADSQPEVSGSGEVAAESEQPESQAAEKPVSDVEEQEQQSPAEAQPLSSQQQDTGTPDQSAATKQVDQVKFVQPGVKGDQLAALLSASEQALERQAVSDQPDISVDIPATSDSSFTYRLLAICGVVLVGVVAVVAVASRMFLR